MECGLSADRVHNLLADLNILLIHAVLSLYYMSTESDFALYGDTVGHVTSWPPCTVLPHIDIRQVTSPASNSLSVISKHRNVDDQQPGARTVELRFTRSGSLLGF